MFDHEVPPSLINTWLRMYHSMHIMIAISFAALIPNKYFAAGLLRYA